MSEWAQEGWHIEKLLICLLTFFQSQTTSRLKLIRQLEQMQYHLLRGVHYILRFSLISCDFFNSASSAESLVLYLPGVCTHNDTEGKQRKARVWNISKSSKKITMFNEHPVPFNHQRMFAILCLEFPQIWKTFIYFQKTVTYADNPKPWNSNFGFKT